ncbi:MAG: cysteine desulfurase [Firmicutes bacterium]|nr:cysteine desulfurase [Bacillota bacterium]
MEQKIYLDNAATTPLSREVLAEMMPYFDTVYGNPSSIHSFGRDARAGVEQARERIAKAIGCRPSEIYFTSGATEANNWVIEGIASANKHKGNHIITSRLEHPSILEACKKLEKQGFRVTYLNADKNGFVRIDELLHYVCPDTILISVMAANNEIGTIQNLQAIAQTAKEKGVIFHTDAVQAIGAVNINVAEMGIDSLTLSGHKLNGPKGVGALYLRHGIAISKLIVGGEQENGLRGGTLNTPAIVGLGRAVELITRDIIINSKKLRMLRDYFINQVLTKIELTQLNGHAIQRLPNNANIAFGQVEGEAIMLMLDMQGIAVSTGSACSSNKLEQSHVLSAIGLPNDLINGSVRFSFSLSNTRQEVDYVVEKLIAVVKKLRDMSPIAKSQVGKGGNDECTTRK